MRFHQHIQSLPELLLGSLGPVVDMHLHAVDFLQQTDGMKALIAAMDASGISHNVVFGLPVRKKWAAFEPDRPHYYLDDNARCYYYALTDEIVATEYQKLTDEERQRIAPTINGFNPTDRFAIDHIEAMWGKYKFWRGIGEVLLRHDDLTNLTLGETARFNHRALDEVMDFCKAKQMPINIHQNSTSVGIHDRFEYQHELTEMLDRHSDTTVLWAHCGASRRVTGKDYAGMVETMLDRYKRLHVDLSWVVYDDIVCVYGVPKPEWIRLINRHPDRFMIGSDLCGHFDDLPKTIGRYTPLLEALDETARPMVARENALRLWFS
jgi:hypothetical protein